MPIRPRRLTPVAAALSGPGGGPPPPVPGGVPFSYDFSGGVYEAPVGTPLTLDQSITENDDWNFRYDPLADITPGTGLTAGDHVETAPVITSTTSGLLTASGATYTMHYALPANGDAVFFVHTDLPGEVNEFGLSVTRTGAGVQAVRVGDFQISTHNFPGLVLIGGLNEITFTISESVVSFSLNGAATQTFSPPAATVSPNFACFDVVGTASVADINGNPIPSWLPRAPSGDYADVFIDPLNQHFWQNGAACGVADVVVSLALYQPGVGFVADGVNVVQLQGQIVTIGITGSCTVLVNGKLTGDPTQTYLPFVDWGDDDQGNAFDCGLIIVSGTTYHATWENYASTGSFQGATDASVDFTYGDLLQMAFSVSQNSGASYVIGTGTGLIQDPTVIGAQTILQTNSIGYYYEGAPGASWTNATVEKIVVWATRQPDVDLAAIAAL
jgi:hypothetical protein